MYCNSVPTKFISSSSMSTRSGSLVRWKAATAALLTLVVVMLGFLAVSPHAHEQVHEDADHPTHECAVTLFSHGKVDAASAPVVVPTPSLTVIENPERAKAPWFSCFWDFSSTRGPPAVLC